MRRLGLIAITAALVAAPAEARPTAELMVVGKRAVLAGPQQVTVGARIVAVGGKRCAIGARTPLSALAGAGLRLRITDLGACSRRPRDAGSLYVRRVGPDQARGRAGWVYKVGRKTGTTGAADPSGSFGTGRRLRDGQRVLWFWCVLGRSGACQRTLEATPDRRTVAPGAALRVTVRGYDDFGRGRVVAGAAVRLGGSTAVTGADGVATVIAPATADGYALEAEAPGRVRAFPTEVRVG